MEMQDEQTVGQRIRIVRTMEGMTQPEFGKRLEVSRDTVNNLERDRVKDNNMALKAICFEFNVSLKWLRDGQGAMRTDNAVNIETLIDLMLPDTAEYKTARAVFLALAKVGGNGWTEFAALIKSQRNLTSMFAKNEYLQGFSDAWSSEKLKQKLPKSCQVKRPRSLRRGL